jgi:hypothetical protein
MMKTQSIAALFLIALSLAGCASDPKSADSAPAAADGKTASAEKQYRYEDAANDLKSEDAKTAKAKKDIYTLVNCTNGIENRTLSIAVDEQGCKLMYEKHEKINVAAESANGTEHCMNAREKIRKRLVTAGWKCIQ